MKFDLSRHPVHLGLGATAVMLPEFEGTMEWYQRYAEAHEVDGAEGRLIAIHHFTEDWPTWEVHPLGAELVYVIKGKLTLVQSDEGKRTEHPLHAGEAAINPPGVWHTGRVSEPTTALFVTAGLGTRNEKEPPAGW